MSPRSFQVGHFPPSFRYYQLIATEFMHAHLRKSKIEDLISMNTTGFLDAVIVVEVSTGSVFKPMRLHTNTFEAIGNELLEQSILTPPEADQAAQLVRMPSAPVGILGLSVSEMKKKCNKHVEDMISNTKYAEQATSGDVSGLPSQILEIVGEYVAAKKDVSNPFQSSVLRSSNDGRRSPSSKTH
jgi:hypothetical protein